MEAREPMEAADALRAAATHSGLEMGLNFLKSNARNL